MSVQTGDVVPGEQLPFSVTRHTPRRNPARRTLSDTGDTPKNADKRRKLETEEHSRGATSKSAGERESISLYSDDTYIVMLHVP